MTVVVETEVVIATDVSVFVIVVVAIDVVVAVLVVAVVAVAVVVVIISFVIVFVRISVECTVENLAGVRVFVNGSAPSVSGEIVFQTVLQTVTDSQRVLGEGEASGVAAMVNAPKAVSLTVAVGHSELGFSVAGGEAVQVFVAAFVLVRPVMRGKENLNHT